MATGMGIITELRLEASGVSGRISCPPGLFPSPGQYLTASSADYSEPVPVVLFPNSVGNGTLCIAPPLPPAWTTGTRLFMRGPLGNGFHMPSSAQRIALASLSGTIARLMPLAYQGLSQHAAIAIYSGEIPHDLPEEVEVLPPGLLPEAQGWADFLAIDAPLDQLPRLREQLGLSPFQRPVCPIRVLVRTEMPCSGLGECGVCSVLTRNGWALACSDGPVFDYNILEGL